MSLRRARAAWATRPERSNVAMLKLMSWISLRLGRPAGRGVLHLIAAYFLLFAPSARRASRAYLHRVLEQRPGLRASYRHIHSFAATIHDRIYLLNDRFDLFDLRIEGEAVMLDALADGRGALLFGAHLGSFEVVRAIGRRHPQVRVALAMFPDNARRIGAALDAINPAARPDIIALGRMDAMLQVRERLLQGQFVGVLADRTPGDEATRPVPVLGAEAPLPLGPLRMAAMLRSRVIFMAGLYLGGNRYAIRFAQIADFSDCSADAREVQIDAALHRYAALIEDCCRQAPYNWFNFFDFWPARPASPCADVC